jgi:uncharacterized protein (TIGR00369 family)
MPDAGTSRADEIREAMASSAFHTWMGMQVAEIEDGKVVLTLETSTHHLNLQGLVHGGVIATLADTAAGLAMRSVIETGSRHVTIDLAVQYLRAAQGGTLTARGTVERKGRSIGFANAEVSDERGRAIARAQVTLALSGNAPGTSRA